MYTYDIVRDSLKLALQHYTRRQEICTRLGQREKFEKITRVVDTMRRNVAKDGIIMPLEEIAEKTSIPVGTLENYIHTITTFTRVMYQFRGGYMARGRRNKYYK